MRSTDFKDLVSILKTAVGRSDEVFRYANFEGDVVWVSDGCLKLWIELDANLPSFRIPLDVLWAFAKHVKDEIEIRDLEDRVLVKSGETVILAGKWRGVNPERAPSGDLEFDVGSFKKGLDFVSRPLEEDDTVAIFSSEKRGFSIVGRSGGISAVYTLRDLKWRDLGLRSVYSSVRRTVKVLDMIEDDGRISIGEDGISVRIGRVALKLCTEPFEGTFEVPKIENEREVPLKPFLRLLERGADILRGGNATLTLRGKRLVLRGESRGIVYSDSVTLEDEGLDFEAIVPVRKLRSYLSNMGVKYVRIASARGVVVFRDRSGAREIYVRGRAL